MAFNASSSDLDDQIYTLDGLSVEEMYKYNWINTVGGLFQFGRKYKYIPWMGYGKPNNLGDQAQDIPWQSASHMPCPEGYRLPTREELESLLPKGQTVPGSYKAGNGERIVYISVLNNISIDCDCDGNPAEPDIHDIGIAASLDPVAIDQACIDLAFAAEGSEALQARVNEREGLHTLEHAEEIGLGSRTYELVNIDK